MEEKKKSGKAGLVVAILAIVLLAGAVVYLFKDGQDKNREIEEMTQLFEIEKEEMENEYSGFAMQYDEMKVHITNDSLIRQLDREKQRTQQLLEELRQTKATNAAEITRLKKELATVREVMRTYIIQIDSLDQVNKQLAKENTRVRQQYQEQVKVVDKLTVEKQQAEEKVALASQLDAAAITVTPRNKRSKEEHKVKNVTQFMVNFTIVKNITVKTGEKIVYLRITKPDGEPLVKDAGNTFQYENVALEYSAKKYIEYTGEQQEVTMYWDVEEYLSAGTYTAYLFVDGVMIGEQSVTLN
jgi:DNA repair exonuclease SbcCD ATPase subunit